MRMNMRLGVALLLGLSACAEVNLDKAAGAGAGCEDPSEDNLVPQAPMLPGRSCMACHRQGGQASGAVWTASGTVYGSGSSACNTGGLEGVKVELADENRKILITLYTNRSGNFFTAEPLSYEKLIARVSKDGKIKEMSSPVPSGDCASCHNPTGPAGARIYLN